MMTRRTALAALGATLLHRRRARAAQAPAAADRPAVVASINLIRDNRTGTVLFMGRLVNPLVT